MSRFAALLAFVGFLLVAPVVAHAQETTFTIGVPGNIAGTNSPNSVIAGQTISTAQVDSVLRTVAPSTFGQNFTRDKANKAFADFANFRTNLASSLIQAVQAQDPSVTVNSLIINTTSINLRLEQKTNSVSGRLGTVSASVSGRKRLGIPLICTSANFSLAIDNLTVMGDYNYITGDVSNARADLVVTNVGVSCNGLLSFVGDFVIALSGINSTIRAAVPAVANQQLAFVNMKRLFSLADFANGLSRFRTETPISAVANRAISIFQEMVNDAAINTPGIALDFNVKPAAFPGGVNAISIYASHAPADIEFITVENEIQGVVPPNTAQIDLYIRPATGGTWAYYTTLFGTGESFFGLSLAQLPANYLVTAIATSSSIGGLQSFPGKTVRTHRANVCGPQAC